MQAFSNICTTNVQALYAIQQLFLKGKAIHLDPMYNSGSMYGDTLVLKKPEFKLDIKPIHSAVGRGDARNIDCAGSSIRSIMFDPPWLITKDSKQKLAMRYGHFNSKKDLIKFIHDIIKEAKRVLIHDGIMIFKCQDFIHDRRKFFMSLIVCNYAIHQGFNLLDEIVINPPSRLRSNTSAALTRHCTNSDTTKFLIFRKKQSRSNYLCI